MGERVVSQSIDLSNLTNSSDIQQQINKYITRIDNMGITIHPENVPIYSNYIQIDGNGFTIKRTNSNNINVANDILLASFQSSGIDFYGMPISQGAPIHTNIAHLGGNTRIGALNSGHTTISYAGINFNNGTNTYGSIDYDYQDINDIEITSYSIEGQLTSAFNYRTNKYMNINKECNATITVSFLNEENETITLNTDTFDAYHNYSQILTYTDEIEVIPDHTITKTYNINFSYEPELGFTTNYSRLYFNLNTTVNDDEKDFTITIYLEFSSPVDPPHFGFGTTVQAIGTNAFAVGNNTIALGNNQFVSGKYNQPDENALFIIGNGINNNNRSNLFVVDGNGNLVIKDGFKIINNTGNYLQIGSNGIDLYGYITSSNSGGSNLSSIESIAHFGNYAQIGGNNSIHTLINTDEIGFYDNNELFGQIYFGDNIRETTQILSFNENDYTLNLPSDMIFSFGVTNLLREKSIKIEMTFTPSYGPADAPLPETTIYYNNDNNFGVSANYTDNSTYDFTLYMEQSTTTGQNDYNLTITDNLMRGFDSINLEITIIYDQSVSGPHYNFGYNALPIGQYAFTIGEGTIAHENHQLAIGKYNIPTNKAVFVIGDGANDNERSNLLTVSESSICIGKGVNTSYNNQFICGRYNEDKENILFAIGNGYNENNRHNILSAHDILGSGTDRITETFNILLPIQTSYLDLSHHPLLITEVLVNNVDQTIHFYTREFNDTILWPDDTIQLHIGDIVEVEYIVVQRYQLININDNTYIGSLPGEEGNYVQSLSTKYFDTSWTFTIPNDIYPNSIFYILWSTGAAGVPTVSTRVIHGTATTINIGPHQVVYNGANTITFTVPTGELIPEDSRYFKGVEYSTTPTIDTQTSLWFSLSVNQDSELYNSLQTLGWLNDITTDINLN